MIEYILLIIILAFVTNYIYKYIKKVQRSNKLTKLIPSLYYNLPFLGASYKFIGTKDKRELLFNLMQDLTLTKLDTFKMWLGPKFIMGITLAEDIKVINNVFIERPFFTRFACPYLGNGVITATGDIWRKSIKTVSPAVSGGVVDTFQHIFNAQSMKLVENLKQEIGCKPFNILDKYIARVTLESICQTALGSPDDISDDIVSDEYFDSFQKCLDLFVKRIVNVLHHPEPVYKYSADYREFQRVSKILHKLSTEMISKKRKERQDNISIGLESKSNGKFKAYLDVLMDMSEESRLSDEQLRAEVDTIVAAGQETSAISLTFTLVMLAKHPAVQEKARNELRNIFGDSKRPVEKEDLERMNYIEAIINETIRLYPAVLMYVKDADKDLKLSNYTIPKDTQIILPLWIIGRSTKNYGDDAAEFNPERWFDDSAPKPAACSPFGCGRRPCIGKRYAFALLKTSLAYCLREFEFLPETKELQFRAGMTLTPIAGHCVSVKYVKKKTIKKIVAY